MSNSSRDTSLDITKGIACFLMVFAHAGTLGRTIDNPVTIFFWYLGWFAPILFFGSVGISLIYQLKKREPIKIILFNILFFIIAFSDIGKEHLNYLDITQVNLIGSLALATSIGIFLIRFNGLLVFILLLILDRLANKLTIRPTLLYGLLFSLIPWAGITTFGNYLYKQKKYAPLFLIIGGLISIYYLVGKHQSLSTQMLTTLFAAMSLIVYSAVVIIAPFLDKIEGISELLNYLGKNTLLFYWVHLFLLFVIGFRLPAPLIWTFVTAVSILLMVSFKRINDYTFSKIATKSWFWLLLVISVFIPALLHTPLSFNFYYFYILTFIFALNYHYFFKTEFPDLFAKFKR